MQLFRALTAVGSAVFIIRFLRSFQVEANQKMAELQADRLRASQQREALKGELYRRVIEAQEAERQRIARDLHDETGQSLTAIGLGLRGLSTSIVGVRLTCDEEGSAGNSRPGSVEDVSGVLLSGCMSASSSSIFVTTADQLVFKSRITS